MAKKSFDDKDKAVSALNKVLKNNSPFKSLSTLVIVLGDGYGCWMAKWANKNTPKSSAIVSIDPCYRGKKSDTYTKRVAKKAIFRGNKAENINLEALLKRHKTVTSILMISIAAHTNAGNFYIRLRKAIKTVIPGVAISAMVSTCCFPGLRTYQIKQKYPSRLQLSY